MQQTQKPQSLNQQNLGDAVSAIVTSTAFSLEAFLHHDFGVRYVGAKGFLGFIILAWPAVLTFRHDPKLPIACVAGLYLLLWFVHQSSVWYRRWKNKIDGSTLYTGTPHLMRLLPFLSEGLIKRLEPLLVLAAAYGLYHLNRPVGVYLLYSGLALLFTSTVVAKAQRKRDLDLSDAVAHQRQTADNFRAMNN